MTARRGPTFVTNIALDLPRPIADIALPAHYTSVLGIVHLHGTPVGALSLPAANQRVSGHAIRRAVVDQLTGPILRHLLAECLIAEGLTAIGDDPTALLHTRHLAYAGPWPRVTAAVCTRGRPDDLRRCVAALVELDYPSLDLLVVDNAPADAGVEDLVRDRYPHVRYVAEPRPGLDWARNRAIVETTAEILAFTDDDAVADRGWLKALVSPMAEHDDVMATTGLVVPDELETEAQQLFERHGGLGRGFARRWVRVRRGTRTTHLANPTTFGTGANMAFRRSVFDEIGGFDPALDAGTASAAGGDTEMFFRLLKTGHTLVYEPAALVRHRHRRDYAAIRSQLENWLIGVRAALTSLSRTFPDERGALMAFAVRLLTLYYPRRVATAAIRSSLSLDLVLAELRGAMRGAGRYDAARREAERVVERFPGLPVPPEPRRVAPMADTSALRAVRQVAVDIDRPLPLALPGPNDADRVDVAVTRSSHRVGTIQLVTGGAPVNRARLSDAIALAHLRDLVDVERARHTLLSSVDG